MFWAHFGACRGCLGSCLDCTGMSGLHIRCFPENKRNNRYCATQSLKNTRFGSLWGVIFRTLSICDRSCCYLVPRRCLGGLWGVPGGVSEELWGAPGRPGLLKVTSKWIDIRCLCPRMYLRGICAIGFAFVRYTKYCKWDVFMCSSFLLY